MKKIYITVASLIVLTIFFLFMMQMLGYKFNKKYVTFNKQECIEQEYPTYANHSGIAGCIFWMRNDYLEKTESWKENYQKDEKYCKEKYNSTEPVGSYTRLFGDEYNDPKCTYEAFKKMKREENWNYLVSKEKDGFYEYCVNQLCPNEPLFK